MKGLIDKYLETKKFSWAASTLKNTKATLNSFINIINGNPEHLINYMVTKKYKPYSQKMIFNQIAAFWDFVKAVDSKNPYKEFRDLNRNLFKNSYVSEKIEITYQEAENLLKNDPDKEFSTWALFLLRNGLRYTEALTEDKQHVLGKGKKTREILFQFEGQEKWSKSHVAFWKKLKKLGMKPHTLRKLSATRSLELGVSLPDICYLYGWTSLQTAARYLQPSRMNKLREVLK